MNRRYCAEMFGTFCLVFAGTGAVTVNQVTDGQLGVVGIGLVFGFIVLAMIYTIGHISGAHLNPVVTLGFFAVGRHPLNEVVPYIFAQLTGAILASFSLRLLFWGQKTTLGVTLPSGPWWQSFLLEFILTFILMSVILCVATKDREEGLLAGMAIGAVIALEALFGGPISGASMNPARSFGPALITGNFHQHWIYWLAPVLGSLTGAQIYRKLFPRPQKALVTT